MADLHKLSNIDLTQHVQHWSKEEELAKASRIHWARQEGLAGVHKQQAQDELTRRWEIDREKTLDSLEQRVAKQDILEAAVGAFPSNCKITRQGDEYFCSFCTLRWSFDETKPTNPACG